MSDLKYIQPDGHFVMPSYTHVVVSERRRTVYVSGQVASDSEGNTVGEGDYTAQAERVYENLRVALAAAGATFTDVTKMTVYVVGLSPEVRAEVGAVRARFLPTVPPASTLVGVSALAMPGWLADRGRSHRRPRLTTPSTKTTKSRKEAERNKTLAVRGGLSPETLTGPHPTP